MSFKPAKCFTELGEGGWVSSQSRALNHQIDRQNDSTGKNQLETTVIDINGSTDHLYKEETSKKEYLGFTGCWENCWRLCDPMDAVNKELEIF